MKKILTFIVATVASVAIASADIILLPHVYGGLGLGTTEGKDVKDYMETKATSFLLGAGVGLNIPFGGYFGIQPGVDFYYNTINAEAKVGSADGSASRHSPYLHCKVQQVQLRNRSLPFNPRRKTFL